MLDGIKTTEMAIVNIKKKKNSKRIELTGKGSQCIEKAKENESLAKGMPHSVAVAVAVAETGLKRAMNIHTHTHRRD